MYTKKFWCPANHCDVTTCNAFTFAGFAIFDMEGTEPRTGTLQQEVNLTPKMKETMAEMITTMVESMQENIWKKLDDYIVGGEASHDGDMASIEATNDWDASRPPYDLQTSPEVVDQYI